MQIQVTYRTIAKMLASALPVQDEEFGAKIEEYLPVIKSLPSQAKNALKCAYIFSRKVPRQEREDMFQELYLAIAQNWTKDERLAYAIARCDWRNWWQKYMTRQHFYAGSLNDTVEDDDGNEVQLSELLVGECEFENKMDGKLDAERIWNRLPANIKLIVAKRLEGKALPAKDRQQLSRFIRKYPMLVTS